MIRRLAAERGRGRVRGAAVGAAALAIALAATGAGAQPAQTDPVRAAEQFDLAMKRKRAGDRAGACEAFAASQRFEPAIGTQLNLAECLERDGKLLAAAEMLRETAATAAERGDAAREQIARAALRALEARIPRFLVEVPAEGEVTATLDGAVVAELGAPIRVDPGLHRWMIAVDGVVRVDREVTIDEGATERVVVPASGDTRVDPPIDRPPVVTPRRSRTLAYVLGAGALVAAGGGAALLVSAHGLQDDADAICPVPSTCDRSDEAQALNDRAVRRSQYGVAAIAGAGVLTLAAGVVWWRATGSDAPPRAAIAASPEGALVTFGGRF